MEKTSGKLEQTTIGGHFSAVLENRCNPLPGKYGYESARAGLYSVLKTVNCHKVFIPHYICDAVPSTIKAAGCDVVFYSINSSFEIDEEIELAEYDIVLLVDYFGLCRTQVENQLALFPKESVIVDCSQAWFQEPFDCLATIFSPRKFLPVPDGGIVNTSLKLDSQESDEAGSLVRYKYLLERVVAEPEASRALYLESEAQLEVPNLRGMSAFTRKLIEVSDQDFIKSRRNCNWEVLSELGAFNELQFDLSEQTPLCYPLMIKGAERLRAALNRERVFTPLYWPGVACKNTHEKAMVNSTIYLPIDHRYGNADMVRLLNFFKEHI